MNEKELKESRKRHEASLRQHLPDIDEKLLQEELDLIESMEASVGVAYYTCDCGRQHEVEYHPPGYDWCSTGSICVCGHEIKFGE